MIKMTIKREYDEFHTGGIGMSDYITFLLLLNNFYLLINNVILEVPDLLNANQVEMLKNWNGELRYLPNFKLQRMSKKKLDELKQKNI